MVNTLLPYQRVVDAISEYSDKCIVCLETAADFNGISNGGILTNTFKVYISEPIRVNDNVKAIVLRNCFNTKKYDTIHGVNVTTIEQTILDLIDNADNVDPQNLLESLANYYYDNNESFDSLTRTMNQRQLEILDSWKDDAISYYEE